MIEIDTVTKRYGNVRVIKNLSLNINQGEIVALIGPNAAGKTTLLKCIMGLVRFRGRILVDGLDVKRKGRDVRRRITYVPQQFSLYDNLSAMENIKFFSDIKGLSSETLRGGLEGLGPEYITQKRSSNLSEGLKQRLMLSIVQMADSPILLLDEPTSNLDPKSVFEFKDLVKSQANERKTVLFSTHLLSDVSEIAKRVIVISKGRLLFEGHIDDLLNKMSITTCLLITLNEDLRPEMTSAVKNLLFKAGAKDVSFEARFITVSAEAEKKMSVLKAVEEAGLKIKDFRTFESSLEEAFLMITHGRDDRW